MVSASEASDMEPRSAKGRRTRAKLIKAAKEVFERDGFLNARIADISETAGMSHGSFYHYFESKEQVFRELAGAQEVSVLDMHETGAPADQSPVDRIRAGNRRYLESYKRETKLMRVIEEVSRYDDDVLVIRVQRQQEFAQKLQASIVRLQKEGLPTSRSTPTTRQTHWGEWSRSSPRCGSVRTGATAWTRPSIS
jgi:AcrR family transcriptional regulator